MLKMAEFPAPVESARVRPRITPESEPFHGGLRNGLLRLPKCSGCGRLHTPPVASCSYCCAAVGWVECEGGGSVHSWVRYHRAFMSEFEGVVPYCVVTVQLDEGVRLFGRWLSSDEPRIGCRVQAVGERWNDGFCGLGFEPRPAPI